MEKEKNIQRIFQEKFEDFAPEPKKDIWGAIEKELDPPKRKLWVPYLSLAASIAVLIASYFIIFQTEEGDPVQTSEWTIETAPAQETPELEEPNFTEKRSAEEESTPESDAKTPEKTEKAVPQMDRNIRPLFSSKSSNKSKNITPSPTQPIEEDIIPETLDPQRSLADANEEAPDHSVSPGLQAIDTEENLLIDLPKASLPEKAPQKTMASSVQSSKSTEKRTIPELSFENAVSIVSDGMNQFVNSPIVIEKEVQGNEVVRTFRVQIGTLSITRKNRKRIKNKKS